MQPGPHQTPVNSKLVTQNLVNMKLVKVEPSQRGIWSA